VDSATGKGVGVISTTTNALLERRAQEKKYELTNFYKFQTREDKKKRIEVKVILEKLNFSSSVLFLHSC
jgi:hypothetical protein